MGTTTEELDSADAGQGVDDASTRRLASVHQFEGARTRRADQVVDRLLGLAEVEHLTRTKKSVIYKKMAEGTFPKSIKLPGSRSVAWPLSRINAWISEAIATGTTDGTGKCISGGAS